MAKLKNYTETMVENLIDSVLDNYPDICRCEQCKLDITALALNNLPPRYIVSNAGELYTKINELDNQMITNIITAITEAAKIVKDNPKHEKFIKIEKYPF